MQARILIGKLECAKVQRSFSGTTCNLINYLIVSAIEDHLRFYSVLYFSFVFNILFNHSVALSVKLRSREQMNEGYDGNVIVFFKY